MFEFDLKTILAFVIPTVIAWALKHFKWIPKWVGQKLGLVNTALVQKVINLLTNPAVRIDEAARYVIKWAADEGDNSMTYDNAVGVVKAVSIAYKDAIKVARKKLGK